MSEPAPSVSVIAGQLVYLLEDDPTLQHASDEDLAARLSRHDRFARARERYPLATDAEIADRVQQLDDRITPEMVREARAQLPR